MHNHPKLLVLLFFSIVISYSFAMDGERKAYLPPAGMQISCDKKTDKQTHPLNTGFYRFSRNSVSAPAVCAVDPIIRVSVYTSTPPGGYYVWKYVAIS